jgi:maltose-binding protein MalE
MALAVFTMQDLIVHVNVDLADKAGVLKDLPVWGSPSFDTWTWDKFVTWLKAGTKVKADGTVEQYGLSTAWGAFASFGAEGRCFVAQCGGQMFDDDWNYEETKSMVDQPPFIEAMQFQYDLVKKHKVAPDAGAEQAIQGGSYRAKRAMAAITWSTPSIFPQDLFQQTWFHLPYNKSKVHAFGPNHLGVNKAGKNTDTAFEWCVTFCVDKDVRTKFMGISSVPAYDPLPILQAAPDGPAKTIGLINVARLKGISSVPADTDNVVAYPRMMGRKAPQFPQTTLDTAVQQMQLDKASVKDALTQAKQKIDAEIAKVK